MHKRNMFIYIILVCCRMLTVRFILKPGVVMKIFKLIKRITLLMLMVLSVGAISAPNEQVVSLETPEKIGYQQTPVIDVHVVVMKKRDLHINLQHKVDGNWNTVKRNFKRIKQSGNYKFKLSLDGLAAGMYRWNAYLTPRKKNWNDRIGQQITASMTIVDAPSFIEKKRLAKIDKITHVEWPKTIEDDQTYTLSIRYKISEARELHIKLFNKKNWQEAGSITIPVSEVGDVQVPFDSLVSNFSAGKYAWVIHLADKAGNQLNEKKFGKHFVIQAKNGGQ